MLKFVQGRVAERYEAGEGGGHSTVRINGTLVLEDGRQLQTQVIFSAADYTMVQEFPRNAKVEFDLQITEDLNVMPVVPMTPNGPLAAGVVDPARQVPPGSVAAQTVNTATAAQPAATDAARQAKRT